MNTPYRALPRTRSIVIAALVTAALAGAAVHAATSNETTAPSSAGQHWHGHHHGPAGRFMHVLKQLNLTAEQQTQIKSIFETAKPQFKSLGTNMRSNAEAMAGISPTDSAYPALLAAAKANAAARIQQMSDVKAQVFAVLTKMQQEQIPQIIAADKSKWQQRHQNGASGTTAPATAS
ncbi:MAG TPA: Spy/CpxP family protein refolding chaperone [Steroidobacteraceae bacterium]